MLRSGVVLSIGLMIWLGLSAGPAAVHSWARGRGQGRGKERGAGQKADELAARAELALSQGKVATALDLYQQAYDRSGQPAHLLQVANCHKALGSAGRAAVLYRRYLAFIGQAPNRAEVEEAARRMEALSIEVQAVPSPRPVTG